MTPLNTGPGLFDMSKKNIIKSIIWALFITFLFLGYLLSGIESKKYHLNHIPSKSNGVIIIDIKEIAKEYYRLFKRKPSELLKLSTGQEIESIQNPGFNPFSKIVAYTEIFNGNILFGLIMPDADPDYFFKTFNLKNETELIFPDESNHLCYYKKNNAFAFIQNNVGFFIKVIHQEKPVNINYAKSYYDFLLADKKKRSTYKNNALDKMKNNKEHLSIWTNSSGFRVLSLNKLFSAMSTSINFKKGKLSLNVDADLSKDHSFIETSNQLTELKEIEVAKLSANVNQQLIKSLVSKYMPKKIDRCLNDWGGGFYLSVIGFRDENVFLNDGTNISKEFNLPELAIGFELDNIDQIKASILNDSLFTRTENGCYFLLNNVKNEKCYLYFNNDHLLFSTLELTKQQLDISFNTFHLNIDFRKFFDLYPTKNIIQRTVLNLFQQQVQLKELNLKYNSRSKNTIHLVGDFFLGNPNQHKLIEFLQQIKSIPIKDVLSTFTSSSRLLVPPIKK